jgi:hypothetical protein
MPRPKWTKEQKLAIADEVRRYMDQRGLSRRDLIGIPRHPLSESSVNKFFRGDFTERTLTYIETILQKTFAPLQGTGTSSDPLKRVSERSRAPTDLGGYGEDIYSNYIGTYLTIRPDYGRPGQIIKCYRTRIKWHNDVSALHFSETRYDRTPESGYIYIPPSSAFLYLITIRQGYVRTVLVSQIVHSEVVMRGLILSQFNFAGSNFMPSCAPIAYIKEADDDAKLPAGIDQTHPKYEYYRGLLRTILSGQFVKMITEF